MSRTSSLAIAIVFLSTLVNASAQTLYKLGTSQASGLALLTNYFIWLGLVFYGISALMLVISLKYGELSVLYPIIATSFIWVNLVAKYIFNEEIGFLKWFGIMAIIFGLTMIGYGEVKNKQKVAI